MDVSFGNTGGGNQWADSFTAIVQSGSVATGSSSGLNLLSWSEVLPDGSVGNWTSGASLRQGQLNLREINNFSGQAFPFYAELNYVGNVSGRPYYYYSNSMVGGGGTGTGPAVTDGIHTVTATTIITFSNSVIVSGSAGSASIQIEDASPSIGGLVNTTTQTFAGNKIFQNSIIFTNSSGPFLTESTYNNGVWTQDGLEISTGDAGRFLQVGWDATNSKVVAQLKSTTTSCFACDGAKGVSGTDLEGDVFTGGIITSIAVSDAKVKNVIGPLSPNLASSYIKSITPTRYTFNQQACKLYGASYDSVEHIGFMANLLPPELQRAQPNMGPGDLVSMDLSGVVAVLWQAVQELQAQVAKLTPPPVPIT